MNTSTWTILVLGILLIAFLAVGMLMTMSYYGTTPAAGRAKITMELEKTFNLTSASVSDKMVDGKRVLKITYITDRDTHFESRLQELEMKSIADFVLGKYSEKERVVFEEIRFTRSEVHGSGCSQNIYKSEYAMPNPKRPASPEEKP